MGREYILVWKQNGEEDSHHAAGSIGRTRGRCKKHKTNDSCGMLGTWWNGGSLGSIMYGSTPAVLPRGMGRDIG